MKRILLFLGLVFLTLLFDNCQCTEEPICKLNNGVGTDVEIIETELIIRITDKVKYLDREKLFTLQDSIRRVLDLERVDIEKIEYCPCGDSTLQKWTVNQPFESESSVRGLKDKTGEEEVEGDVHFTFSIPDEGDGLAVAPDQDLKDYKGYQNEYEEGIGIAVLDTGLDLDYVQPGTLFKNPEREECGEPYSGWNFVNNSADIQDDHGLRGHGTLVTKIITKPLDSIGIPYRIMPLKIFDREGKGSYWNILCAMKFVVDINKRTKGAIKIVNASFGANLGKTPEKHLSSLKYYIDLIKEDAILVASAGNCHFDTDKPEYNHYPSGLSSSNILAVGGYKKQTTDYLIHEKSNYGLQKIDISAPFEHKLLLNVNGTMRQLNLPGTSFSAAYISYLMALPENQDAVTGNAVANRDFFVSHPDGVSTQLANYIGKGGYFD